jgi:Signal peptidase subunit
VRLLQRNRYGHSILFCNPNTPDDAQIQLYSASQMYRCDETTGNFRDVNATYALRWNIVPWVGMMQWGKRLDGYIALPPQSLDTEGSLVKVS